MDSSNWYLLNNLGYFQGYESDEFNENADGAFDELLNTSVARQIIYIKNGDFATENLTKAIVDTQKVGNSYRFKVKKELIDVGDYIKFQDEYWLVNTKVFDNHFYDVGDMEYCTEAIKYMVNDEVYEYPYYVSSVGVSISENKFIITSGTQRKIVVSRDAKTSLLHNNLRFMGEDVNGIPIVWKILDITPNDGLLEIKVEKDEYSPDKDNLSLRLCDYQSISPTPIGDFEILGTDKINIGKTSFYNCEIPVDFTITNIDETENEYVEIIEQTDTTIKLKGIVAGKFITLTATDTQSGNTTSKVIKTTNKF